jgi:hypothetical protein
MVALSVPLSATHPGVGPAARPQGVDQVGIGQLGDAAQRKLRPRRAPTARYRLMMQVNGMSTDRCWPWVTAADRWLGHIEARPAR